MTATTQMRIGPEITPSIIRTLIIITCGVSLFAGLTEPLLQSLFALPGLSTLLSLSWSGIRHFYLWQIVTYLFVEPTYGYGIGFSFLLSLAFNMYLLWVMGSDLYDRIGKAGFLRFYLLSGIFAGLIALAVMAWLGRGGSVSGPLPAILAVVTAWTLFNPEIDLFFFFLFPIKAKWLWVALAGALLLLPLSHLDWVSFAFHLAPLLFGYLYAIIAWELRGPFSWTHPFDRALQKRARGINRKATILDFKTGEPLDDARFVDAMLDKISKKGEASLSWKERKRLQEISLRKKKK